MLPVAFIVISPLLGMTIALVLTVGLSWLLNGAPPGPLDRVFRRLQLVSAGLYSLSHGANDAQKTMGIIVSLLVASQASFRRPDRLAAAIFYLPSADHIPLWIVLAAHTAIALGTAAGGWRIVKTMGTRITRLRPVRRVLRRNRGWDHGPAGVQSGSAGEHDTHDHRGHRGGRRGSAPVGGALGSGQADRLGLDPHHADERGDRGVVVSDFE